MCVYCPVLCFQTPLGQIHLWNARIEEVDRSKDSGSDSDDLSLPHYTIAIWPVGQEVTYLMIATCREKVSLSVYLIMISNQNSDSGLARFSHPGKYRAVITGNYRPGKNLK